MTTGRPIRRFASGPVPTVLLAVAAAAGLATTLHVLHLLLVEIPIVDPRL